MINFEERTHTYTHERTKEQYTSVTTLLHEYVPEFDSAYWSLYKAIKDILGNYNQFKTYKLSVGGWENVVSSWRRNPLMKYQDEVESKQEDYLIEWQLISETACEVGTAEHKRRELESQSTDYYEYNGTSYETPLLHSQTDILRFQDFANNRVYTELLVYNDRYKVAGQVDWVLKKGRNIWIKDYKTSKEITKEAFRDKKMLTPLNDLPDANFYHYAIQMSTYAWMLEQCGYNIKRLEIIHTRTEDVYEMPYLKEHVERMMEDHSQF